MAPARGGDRTDRRNRCPVPAGRLLTVLVVVGLGVVSGGWAASAGAASGSHHPPSSGSALTLLTPPTLAGPASPFTVRLGLARGASPADLTLGITVYAPLETSTALAETLGGSPVGSVLARSPAFPWSTLTPDPAHENGVDLSLPVTAGDVTGAGSGPYTVNLHCDPGSCDRVYPLQLVLTDTATHSTSWLLTYLTYTDPAADIEPLRFALVLPLNLAPSPPDPAPAVTDSSLASLTSLVEAISGSRAAVPLTIIPSPATLSALHSSRGEKARTALSSLLSLVTEPGRQTLCGSFVPVNASSLVTGSVAPPTELAEQIRRGAQVLEEVAGLHSACVGGGAWVSDTTLNAAALGGLGALGFDDIVVPPSAVAGPTLATTPTRRFTLAGAPRSGSAILSDPQLSSLLESASPTDPAVAAGQLLAELEFDYTEYPNTPKARGVVAALPAVGQADPTVVTEVLDGLQNNPMVKAVTLSTMFSDVPIGGSVGRFSEPTVRPPAPVAATTGPTAQTLEAARDQWAGFSAAVSGTSVGNGRGHRPRRPPARIRIARADATPAESGPGPLRQRLSPPTGSVVGDLASGPSHGTHGERPDHRHQDGPVPRPSRPDGDERQDRLLHRRRPGTQHRVPGAGDNRCGRPIERVDPLHVRPRDQRRLHRDAFTGVG